MQCNRKFDESAKNRVWDGLERDALRLTDRLTPQQNVFCTENISMAPAEFTLTRQGRTIAAGGIRRPHGRLSNLNRRIPMKITKIPRRTPRLTGTRCSDFGNGRRNRGGSTFSTTQVPESSAEKRLYGSTVYDVNVAGYAQGQFEVAPLRTVQCVRRPAETDREPDGRIGQHAQHDPAERGDTNDLFLRKTIGVAGNPDDRAGRATKSPSSRKAER